MFDFPGVFAHFASGEDSGEFGLNLFAFLIREAQVQSHLTLDGWWSRQAPQE